MRPVFTLLGTGTGPGVPSFFCTCPACREAEEDSVSMRTRSGAFLETEHMHILIDAPPDLRLQLLREKIDRIDCLFMTHWHYDHFGGLGELEYYVKLKRKQPIALYLPPSACAAFAAAFPNLLEVFTVNAWEFGKKYRFDDVEICPLPAKHGIETAGFLLTTDRQRAAYFPDTAGLPPDSRSLVAGVDWLFCDATFHGENWYEKVHMSVKEALLLGQEIGAGHTVLTHLSIHYSHPVTKRELCLETAEYAHASAGYDGMKIRL